MRRDSNANNEARRTHRTQAAPNAEASFRARLFPTSSNSFEAQSSDRAGSVLDKRASKALRTPSRLYTYFVGLVEGVGLVAIRRAFTSTGGVPRQASDEMRH